MSPPLFIAITALDTTWRIFVPVLVGVGLGIWLDHLLMSAPLATIVCLVLGSAGSFLLIARQLRAVSRRAPTNAKNETKESTKK